MAMTQSERVLRSMLRGPIAEWDKKADRLPAAFEDMQMVLGRLESEAQTVVLLVTYVGARVGASAGVKRDHQEAANEANNRLTRVRRAMGYTNYSKGRKV